MDNGVYQYFKWLCAQYCTDGKHDLEKFSRLLEFLFDREYYWSVPYDENRAKDGESVRWFFWSEATITGDNAEDFRDWDNATDCTVLEMLCGLAKRVEDYLGCEVGGKEKPSRWFWLMLENCGLAKFDDEHWDEMDAGWTLDFVLERGYDRNGNGGFWPLTNPEKDQRKVDLWYQANSYFVEKRK